MVGNPIFVKIIESTIDKTIRDLRNNPKAGVKNLVDLGNRFASSPTQKDLMATLQMMLRDPNSPYHKIIPALATNVNSHTLKTFIINIFYNSWSHGGKKIKQYKNTYNYNIPWTIIFDFTGETDNHLSNNIVIHTIEQGKKLGIYTYIFFINNLDDFSYIQKQNPDCAFILFIPPGIITKETIRQVKSYHNAFISILYEPATNMNIFRDATQLLFDNQCLFGSHTYYTNENIDHVLSNQWICDIITPASPFAFLIESQHCIPTNASLIHNYVYNSKIKQNHPAFLIDLYEDITQVSNQFSKGASILKIMSNGDIAYDPLTTSTKININNTTLFKVVSPRI